MMHEARMGTRQNRTEGGNGEDPYHGWRRSCSDECRGRGVAGTARGGADTAQARRDRKARRFRRAALGRLATSRSALDFCMDARAFAIAQSSPPGCS